MTALLTPFPKFRAFDANGHPLAGGKLYTYTAGTTTPKATYVDAAGVSPNTNPILLDADGEADVWLDGLYKFRLDSALDVPQWTIDNVGDPPPPLPDFPIVSRDYGNDLSAAVAAIGSTYTKLAITAPTTVTANLTIPRNIQLWVWPAGVITINPGITLILYGAIDAGESKLFAGTGILEYRSPTPMSVYWFGAVADNTTDSSPAFAAAIAAAQTDTATAYGSGLAVLVIPPGRYHLSSEWLINKEIRMTGYGAQIDHTVRLTAFPVHMAGLTVNGAAGVGFYFERAQVGTFIDLLAANCGSHGFQLGGSNLTDAATRGLFIRCSALGCTGNGLYLRENPGISVNANTFLQFDSKGCAVGIYGDGGGAGVSGNTFIGTLAEGNITNEIVFTNGMRDWLMLGGYIIQGFVDDSANQGMILGAHIRDLPTGTATRLFETYFETGLNDIVFRRSGKDQQRRDGIIVTGLSALGTPGGTGPFVVTLGDAGEFVGSQDAWIIHFRIASLGAPSDATRRFFLNIDILVAVDNMAVYAITSDEVSSALCTLGSVVLNTSGTYPLVEVTFSTTNGQTMAARNASYYLKIN